MNFLFATLLPLFAYQTFAQTAGLDTVPYEDYVRWDRKVQMAYDKEARAAFFEFETSTNLKTEFAQLRRWDFSPWPEAFAAGAEKVCLVGGVRRAMSPLDDRYVCPTGGRGCPGQSDEGFLCGTIYNEVCVSREPRDSISKRCRETAGDAPIDEAKFNERRGALQSVAADCRSGVIDDRFKSQCQNFLSRMNRLNAAPASAVRPVPAAGDELVARPPAPVRTRNVPAPIPAQAPKVGPPAETHREATATGDCMARQRAKLGTLACVACGMEKAAPAEILNHGGGVGKWVALLGVMAQQSYGPYNVNDQISRQAFQQRVAEMVSSYGYCTDREYPITPANGTRDFIDGKPLRGQQALQFSQNFGLMSTVGGFFSSTPENQNEPLRYAQQIFNDGGPTGWDAGNAQNRQWRFRSMLKAHRQSYKASPFSQCANAVESRLATSKNFRMCPMRQGQWPNGHPRMLYPSHVTPQEMANNQGFYEAMASSCGLPKQRKIPSQLCDHNCWGNQTFRHASSQMYQCDPGGQNTYAQAVENGKAGEPSKVRNPGKPGEPAVGRGTYGGNHGNADNGNGGGTDGGGVGAGPGGGTESPGGKGGEAGSTR